MSVRAAQPSWLAPSSLAQMYGPESRPAELRSGMHSAPEKPAAVHSAVTPQRQEYVSGAGVAVQAPWPLKATMPLLIVSMIGAQHGVAPVQLLEVVQMAAQAWFPARSLTH